MFKRGNVVRSIKGRDKDKLSVVLSFNDNKVYISDGKEHKLTKPKLKNPKHIENLNISIDESFEAEGKEDYEMLSDMIVAASNEACKQIDKTTADKMAKYSALTGGFGGLF